MKLIELAQNGPIFVGYTINVAITFGTLAIHQVKSQLTITSLASVLSNTITLSVNTLDICIHSICNVTITSNTFGFNLIVIIRTFLTSTSSVSRTTITLSIGITFIARIFCIICIAITTYKKYSSLCCFLHGFKSVFTCTIST